MTEFLFIMHISISPKSQSALHKITNYKKLLKEKKTSTINQYIQVEKNKTKITLELDLQ